MDGSRRQASGSEEETLDPADWGEALALSRRIVDDAVGYLRDVRDRPVWREMPRTWGLYLGRPVPPTSPPAGQTSTRNLYQP